jgi:hypothetical protein
MGENINKTHLDTSYAPDKERHFSGLPFGGTYSAAAGAPELSQIKIYLKTTVKSKRTILDYTWRSMVAEIGGYSGLLLGVSVCPVT